MSVFVTRDQTVARIASRHTSEIVKAVEDINKVIKEAPDLPVKVPAGLLTSIDSVRAELIRKLRQEAHWVVHFRYADHSYTGVLDNQVEYLLLDRERPEREPLPAVYKTVAVNHQEK
jgi:hypothetical protein